MALALAGRGGCGRLLLCRGEALGPALARRAQAAAAKARDGSRSLAVVPRRSRRLELLADVVAVRVSLGGSLEVGDGAIVLLQLLERASAAEQGGLEVRSLVERVGALVDGVAVHVLHEVAGGAVGEERRLLLGAGEGHLDSLAVGGERLPHVALAEVRIALALVLGSLGLERVDLVVRGVSLVHHRSQLSRILVEPEIGLDTWKDVGASGGAGVSDGGRGLGGRGARQAARRINRGGEIFLATQNPGLLGHTLSEGRAVSGLGAGGRGARVETRTDSRGDASGDRRRRTRRSRAIRIRTPSVATSRPAPQTPAPPLKAPNAREKRYPNRMPRGDPPAKDGDRGRREIEAGVAPSSRFE